MGFVANIYRMIIKIAVFMLIIMIITTIKRKSIINE